ESTSQLCTIGPGAVFTILVCRYHPANAEVGDLYAAIARDKKIGWLQIAMRDIAVVRYRDGTCGHFQDGDDVLARGCGTREAVKPTAEISTVNIFVNKERGIGVICRPQQFHDILVGGMILQRVDNFYFSP